MRKIEEVRIYDVMQERISNFISSEAATAERFGVKLKAAASPDEAIDEADVITTVTISKTPVFDGKRVKPGAPRERSRLFTRRMRGSWTFP